MINSIHIINFQSHKDTFIDFTTGVNVLVGVSDSGKSAVIRALKWVIYNNPMGDAFRSWDGGDTSVTVDIDGGKVTRYKTNSTNGYKVEGYEKEFKALGNDVPEEIKDIFRMQEINLQQQGDSFFLISNTAGEVAKHFNGMAKLENIDIGITNAKKRVKETNNKIEIKKIYIKDDIEGIDSFEYLQDFENKLNSVLLLDEKTKNINAQINGISSIVTKINSINKKHIVFENTLCLKDSVMYLEHLIEKKKSITKDGIILKKVIKAIKITDDNIAVNLKLKILSPKILKIEKNIEIKNTLNDKENSLNHLIKRYKRSEKAITSNKNTLRLQIPVNNLEALYGEEKDIYEKITSLNTQIQKHASNKLHIDVNGDNLLLYKKQFKENMPDICPLCGNPVKS
jgi:exonuclease SbcC